MILSGGTSIHAQSIGGGGGIGTFSGGGMALGASNSFNVDADVVTVSNNGRLASDNGTGIIAQSIGGGGGVGSQALAASIALGGTNTTGWGGDVNVTHTVGDINGNRGGIFAQSIGAGGGLAIGPANGVTLGGNDANGTGRAVTVTVTGGTSPVPTTINGQTQAGIMAQSIGGGGGWSQGADTGTTRLGGIDVSGANGRVVTVSTGAFNNISTFGANAYGMAGQSIGGGGGIANKDSAGGTVIFGADTGAVNNAGDVCRRSTNCPIK